MLTHAFVSSKLDHCNSLLYRLPAYQLNKLQLIQNTAARIVSFARKYDHITPVLQSLHWLPVQSRINFKILLLVYKALNGMAPSYLSDFICYRTSTQTLRSTSQKFLAVSQTNTKSYGDRVFSVASPKLWYQLPLNIRQSSTVGSFKKELKTYLFKLAYDVQLWFFLSFSFFFFFFIRLGILDTWNFKGKRIFSHFFFFLIL